MTSPIDAVLARNPVLRRKAECAAVEVRQYFRGMPTLDVLLSELESGLLDELAIHGATTSPYNVPANAPKSARDARDAMRQLDCLRLSIARQDARQAAYCALMLSAACDRLPVESALKNPFVTGRANAERSQAADEQAAAWQEQADAIWLKQPWRSARDVAGIIARDGGNAETIRRKISKTAG